MASLVANVQVWSDAPPDTAASAMERIETDRYVRAAPEERADRTALVLHAGRWNVVFDDLLDGGGPQEVERIAAALSRELRTWTLGIRADQDELRLRLFRDGVLIDGYGGGVPAPRAQRWKDLLARGRKPSELTAAFSRKWRFAEERLEELASLLGLDPGLAALSGSTLAEAAVEWAGAVRLPLRRLAGAAAEPRLSSVPSPFESKRPFDGERWVGEQVLLEPFFTSRVPLSRGLRLEVSGTAVQSQILEVADRGMASAHDPGAETAGRPQSFRFDARHRSSGVLAASLSPSLLPPAAPVKNPSLDRLSIKPSLQLFARAPGEGQLVLRLVPDEAPAGAAERVFHYRVVPMPSIEFPSGARAGRAPALRRLYTPRVLSLTAVLEGGASRLPEFAPLLLRWAAFVRPGPGTWVAATARGVEPFDGSAEGLDHSARWLELVAAATRGARLLLTCIPPDGAPPPLPFGHPRTPRRDGLAASRINRDAFQLGFWARREPLTPERERAACALLREIAASLAMGGGLLQAALVQQDWAPTGGLLGEAPTPYEEARLSPLALSERRDLRLELRHVAAELWLGAQMLPPLDRRRVDSVAQVEQAGDAWWLRLREGRALVELERALQALLA